jgi:ribose 5-phosphate isomerase B
VKVAIASDHAGLNLKKFLQEQITSVQWIDCGPQDAASVDYPDFAEKACVLVQNGKAEKAVLICGSGIGMSIAANKLAGIRAAHVESNFTARLAAEHNNANTICIGERVTAPHYALEMVNIWLQTKFAGSRHQNRLDKITALEKKS